MEERSGGIALQRASSLERAMPPITIEYSKNIGGCFDPSSLALSIHDAAVRTVQTELESCKTRIVEQPLTVIGDGSASEAMLHVDLRILSGRSDEQKTALANAAIALVADSLKGRTNPLRVQATVEVRELDRENYLKILV